MDAVLQGRVPRTPYCVIQLLSSRPNLDQRFQHWYFLVGSFTGRIVYGDARWVSNEKLKLDIPDSCAPASREET